jgi:hypothetical protein
LEGIKNMAEHGKEKECYKWQSRVKEQQMMSMHSMLFTWWNIVLEEGLPKLVEFPNKKCW